MLRLWLVTLICLVAVNAKQPYSPADGDRCTTMITGKKAGTQGPMTTHTADCANCDFRMNKVPSKLHAKGSMRKVYEYKSDYPANVCEDRGETWKSSNLEGTREQIEEWSKESIITTLVPQVEKTYAIIEAGYGIMNEHQVAMGESTCAARYYAFPPSHGGKARIEVREMSRIALERTTNARDAIKLMGALAVELGYYAADFTGGDASKGEGGEALTVIDTEEAWVFHVLADDTGTSAVWAAQRVPDDHIAAVANSFVIRKIDPDSDDFLYSTNIFDVGQRTGHYHPTHGDGLLDFLPTFAPMRTHSTYSTRRVWRVFSLAAPSSNLPGETDPYGNDYPFSVKVDRPLAPLDLMNINRDHYEGTQYDMTKGVASGPYGDPARFDVTPTSGMTMEQALDGSYERSISIFRTSYSFVAVARAHLKHEGLAMLWFGQYQPSTSQYVPLYIHADPPTPLTRGSLFKYDSDIPFWNYLAVNNYGSRFYKYAITDIKAMQSELDHQLIDAVEEFESNVEALMKDTESGHVSADSASRVGGSSSSSTIGGEAAKVMKEGEKDVVAVMMDIFCAEQVSQVSVAWRDLLPRLITKFHDGYIAETLTGSTITMTKMFYPKWWLKVSGYFDPANAPNPDGPDTILFNSRDAALHKYDSGGYYTMGALLMSIMAALVVGYTLGYKAQSRESGKELDSSSHTGLLQSTHNASKRIRASKIELPTIPEDTWREVDDAITNSTSSSTSSSTSKNMGNNGMRMPSFGRNAYTQI